MSMYTHTPYKCKCTPLRNSLFNENEHIFTHRQVFYYSDTTSEMFSHTRQVLTHPAFRGETCSFICCAERNVEGGVCGLICWSVLVCSGLGIQVDEFIVQLIGLRYTEPDMTVSFPGFLFLLMKLDSMMRKRAEVWTHKSKLNYCNS